MKISKVIAITALVFGLSFGAAATTADASSDSAAAKSRIGISW